MDFKFSIADMSIEFERVYFKQMHIAVLLINMQYKKIIQHFSKYKNVVTENSTLFKNLFNLKSDFSHE